MRSTGWQATSSPAASPRPSICSRLPSQARAAGRKIAAYGAAAKGNTFLNVCGIADPQVEAVYDRSTEKQGRLTPGSHIPIRALLHQRVEA